MAGYTGRLETSEIHLSSLEDCWYKPPNPRHIMEISNHALSSLRIIAQSIYRNPAAAREMIKHLLNEPSRWRELGILDVLNEMQVLLNTAPLDIGLSRSTLQQILLRAARAKPATEAAQHAHLAIIWAANA